jgi:hypothetical protein
MSILTFKIFLSYVANDDDDVSTISSVAFSVDLHLLRICNQNHFKNFSTFEQFSSFPWSFLVFPGLFDDIFVLGLFLEEVIQLKNQFEICVFHV